MKNDRLNITRMVREDTRVALRKAAFIKESSLDEGTALVPYTPPSVPAVPSSGTVAKTIAKGATRTIGGSLAGAAMAGGAVSKAIGDVATGTETGRSVGKWIGQNVPGAKSLASGMRDLGNAIGVRNDAPKSDGQSSAPQSVKTQTISPSQEPKGTIKGSVAKAPAVNKSTPVGAKGGFFKGSPNVSKGDYTIAKGDTLSGIAKKYGTSVGAIQSMNKGLTDVNKIAAGGKLNLPTTTKSAAPKPAEAPKATAPEAPKAATPEAPKPVEQPKATAPETPQRGATGASIDGGVGGAGGEAGSGAGAGSGGAGGAGIGPGSRGGKGGKGGSTLGECVIISGNKYRII